jgi:hypothetical protein
MERSHIEAEGHVIRKPLLEFGDDPEGMDRILGISICIFDPEGSFRGKCREEAFDVGCEHERTQEVGETGQAGGDISENLDGRGVKVVDIRPRGIEVDDPRGSRMILDRRVVLNGIVTHRDDHIRCHKEFVPRCVVELTDTSSKPLEEVGGDSSCSPGRCRRRAIQSDEETPERHLRFPACWPTGPTRAWAVGHY